MAGNDTAALVVALSAQLSRFERDMKQAGDIADRTASGIEDRFSRLNPVASSFLGNFASNLVTKGFEKAIDLVQDLTRRFTELDATAKLVGVSMNEIFGVQQAAGKFGAPVDDVTASLRNLAVLLDQLQRGEKNSLSNLFDANPQALQGVNVQALNLQQAFEIVANLVQNARTEIQKIDLAKAAGQTASMVRFLELGAERTTQLSAAAAATAPDLQKLADEAKAFDDAWKKATDNVKGYLGQNLFSFIKTDLQDIVALLQLAAKFLELFKGGPLDRFAQDADKVRAAAGTLQNLIDARPAGGQIDESAGLNTAANARNDQRAFNPAGRGQAGTSTVDPSRGLSNVPLSAKEDNGKDAFDRTEEQITRHTAVLKADTLAVAENNAVQAQLRAEFELLNAIRKDDGEVTQAQIDAYEKFRASMSATQALQAAGITLTEQHAQAFLTTSQNIGTATAAMDQARETVNKLNSASATLGSSISTALGDIVFESKNADEALKNLLKTLGKAGLNSLTGAFFNVPSSGGLSPFASLVKGIIPGFAGGTDDAPGGLAWVGENGKELVNLPRGSQVIPNNISRRISGGATLQITNNIAGDISPATIDNLQRQQIATQRKLMQIDSVLVSTQRMQTSGVG
ncbi:hypothetical protein [Bradyrhizobium liaoningense]|uniref:hypothetical protein n=1 Tax=Bradyrhizobium liaoningense TaxID=43992 RepID=UPI001BA60F46|nr:hypothetical protein [Bradyrhizobium liaoningense]MBR0855669.1 hypothetical protein [Bradyrhizobium liaoningense]